MLIHEAATRTGLPARRIRCYESLGLVRAARQGEGAYRSFSDGDLERLRFIAGSRRAGLSLDEVAAVLRHRDSGVAPCDEVLAAIDRQIGSVDSALHELRQLHARLLRLRREGAALPRDDVLGERCICSLVKSLA